MGAGDNRFLTLLATGGRTAGRRWCAGRRAGQRAALTVFVLLAAVLGPACTGPVVAGEKQDTAVETASVRDRAFEAVRGGNAARLRALVEQVGQSVQSWIAHAAHADTFGLRRRALREAVFQRG